MECPCWDGVLKIDGLCYYHAKLGVGVIRTNGHRGSAYLTDDQRRRVGLEDEDTTGRWDYTATSVPDLLTQMIRMEPAQPWDRTVPRNREKSDS